MMRSTSGCQLSLVVIVLETISILPNDHLLDQFTLKAAENLLTEASSLGQ